MKNTLTALKAYWFSPMPVERLAILRIATGGFSIWYLLSRFGMLQRMVSSDTSNFEPVGILSWMSTPLPPDLFYVITIILIGLNIAFILGWKFRTTGPLFAVLLFLFLTYRNSWSMIYHNRIALLLQVLVIGFAASADALSLDALQRNKNTKPHWGYGWPIRLICAATVVTYFLAGTAKLTGDLAVEWATGEAMRSQVAVDAIRKVMLGAPAPELFETLYPHTWIFFVAGVLTLVLEIGAPLALLKKRYGTIWVILTWMMHWGIFFIMGISFRHQMSGIIFLPFFETEKGMGWIKKWVGKLLSTQKKLEAKLPL